MQLFLHALMSTPILLSYCPPEVLDAILKKQYFYLIYL